MSCIHSERTQTHATERPIRRTKWKTGRKSAAFRLEGESSPEERHDR
jgi:hypothetical protein